jgi:hypothetical protein
MDAAILSGEGIVPVDRAGLQLENIVNMTAQE